MELKTLKDLQLGYEGHPAEDENIRKGLRIEAIKWIKKIQEDKKSNIQNRKYSGDLDSIIWWIKCFFNITDEDLE